MIFFIIITVSCITYRIVRYPVFPSPSPVWFSLWAQVTWSVCPSFASTAEEIPPLALLRVALIKPFLYSRKSCSCVCTVRARLGRRGRGRKKSRRKESGFRYFFCQKVFVYIKWVHFCCSIMSLACVRDPVARQCGSAHTFGRLVGESLSYLIFISDSGND